MSDRTELESCLETHGIELPPEMVLAVEHYCHLLWEWNEKLNLTRHTDFERFVTRDLVDCLELGHLLAPGETVLDVGSGGGVPGIVLAIIRPDVEISLAESVGKKAAVLAELVEKLDLPVPVLEARAEHLLGDMQFNSLVARAVGPLWKMLKWFEPHWESFDRLLAIKGPRWVEERGEARHLGYLKQLELRKVASYPMVGTESESVILQIWPKDRATS